jgi:hypothetical protein
MYIPKNNKKSLLANRIHITMFEAEAKDMGDQPK